MCIRDSLLRDATRVSDRSASSPFRVNPPRVVCVPRHNSGKHQSSNAYANGSDQNCGNVITDRPTTRLHAPPGGHSSISFGADDAARDAPRSSRETQQNAFGDARSNVDSQVFGAPSDARAQSSNAYANGADQNCGNCITCLLYTSPSPRDLSTSRMPSSA